MFQKEFHSSDRSDLPLLLQNLLKLDSSHINTHCGEHLIQNVFCQVFSKQNFALKSVFL